jgi:FlaG/FlaF family flagellin (archaellin)
MEELNRQRPSQSPAQPEEAEEGGLIVAILLALAATVAAVLGARAAVVSSAASAAWQTAVREEVKRSAALVEDVRYVYAVEAAVALRAAAAAVEADELRQSADSLGDAEKTAAESEAFIRQTSADALAGAFDLTKDPRYRAGDGYDIASRLADVRNEHPDLVALDPGATMDKGGEDSRHGWSLVAATIPAAVAFLCGSLAQGFPRYRSPLMVAGFAFLVLAAGAAVLVEAGVA